jgi:hypothetical protein
VWLFFLATWKKVKFYMRFDTFFHGLLRKRVIRGDPCCRDIEKIKRLYVIDDLNGVVVWYADCYSKGPEFESRVSHGPFKKVYHWIDIQSCIWFNSNDLYAELEKSSTYSHSWLGLNPQIGRPLSRIIVLLVYLKASVFWIYSVINCVANRHAKNNTHACQKKSARKRENGTFACEIHTQACQFLNIFLLRHAFF